MRLSFLFCFVLAAGCSPSLSNPPSENNTTVTAPSVEERANAAESDENATRDPSVAAGELAVATLGNGCFWCTEAVFHRLKGVTKVESGYSGGITENPTYREVCFGTTGHAEVVQITYDPQVITFGELLEVFFKTHDPTTLNRQGFDVGTQYRSVIFYQNDWQKQVAQDYKEKLDKEGVFHDPIVTEITQFEKFYVAENYHQDYFEINGFEPYCQRTIIPKVEKLHEEFADKLKDEVPPGDATPES